MYCRFFLLKAKSNKNLSYPSLRASICESGALWQQLAMNGVKQPNARKITPVKIPSNLDSALFILGKPSVRAL